MIVCNATFLTNNDLEETTLKILKLTYTNLSILKRWSP